MRQGFITLALLANAVSSGLILWLLVAGGDGATRLSGRQGEVLIVVAAALLLDLLLVPVLGISFWARDRARVLAPGAAPGRAPRLSQGRGRPHRCGGARAASPRAPRNATDAV